MAAFQRFSIKKALSGFSSYYGTSGVNLRRTSAVPEVSKEQEEAAKYHRKYVYNNKLHSYLNGFKELDNILNVFFVSYGKVPRSSLNCARLWVAAMETRFQLINAVSHLVQNHDYLSYEYKDLRMEELDNHIIRLKNLVAGLVQYIVIFQEREEMWRFLRMKFLEELSLELYNGVKKAVSEYREFLIKSYCMKETVAKAYRKHLKRQKLVARKALHDVEFASHKGKQAEKLFEKLEKAFKVCSDAKFASKEKKLAKSLKENEYQKLRMLLTVSKDAFAPRENGIFDYNKKNEEEIGALLENDFQKVKAKKANRNNKFRDLIDNTQKLVEDLVDAKTLEDDKLLYSHQKGLKSIGPFELIILSDAYKYVEAFDENKWSLSSIGLLIHGLKHFENVEGRYIPAGTVSKDKQTKQNLRLHKDAHSYAWFFPLDLSGLSEKDRKELDMRAQQYSPLHALVFYGGFGYFNKEGILVEIKGITLGDDMYFDGPYYIPKEETFNTLEKEGMPLVPTTIPGLEQHSFTYVSREHGDKVIDPQYNLELKKFKGAFAYKGKEKGEDLRNYFQIQTFGELEIKEEKNSNTPIMEHILFLYNKYKKEWLGSGLVLEEDVPQTQDPSHMWHITEKKIKWDIKTKREQRRNEFSAGKTMFHKESHTKLPGFTSRSGSIDWTPSTRFIRKSSKD
eukprot:augustus_masked-scaffold_14-processed-gene-7.0-mRNA-1 protein AED:1.00 eAED:1.00 QI:0/-1/0/0/-1/1/1/0/678